MKIGLLFGLDDKTVLDYIGESDRDIIRQSCLRNNAPAVNTLMLSLLKAGHFVRVFTIAQKNFVIKADKIEIYGIAPVDNYFIKYTFGCFVDAKRIKDVLKNHYEDLDVIHAHWTYVYAYAAKTIGSQKPVYVTVRDWASYIWKIESTKNKVFWSFRVLMNELVVRNKNIKLVANSPYTAERIKKKLGIEVPTIPNSIKDEFVTKTEHKNPDVFTILCISSSNDKRKNVVTLLKAYQLFRKKRPQCKLRLIGPSFINGNPTIETWRNLDLLDGVELLGPIQHEELKKYLDSASVFVTPSLEETFGNTLLESIARKVPVIGGEQSGAVPFVLHHGKAGILCDVASASAIDEKIEYVYSHPNEMRLLTDEAYMIINKEYSETAVCEKHIKMYRGILN